MKSLSLSCVVAFMIVGLVGCTTRLVDFTVISTKNVDLSRAASFQRGKARVEGIDKVHIIIFIPIGGPNMKEAIDRALEKVPGAIALVDGVVYSYAWYIPYIYGQSMFVVEGLPLIDPSLASADRKSDYVIGKLDGAGDIEELRFVSGTEYEGVRENILHQAR